MAHEHLVENTQKKFVPEILIGNTMNWLGLASLSQGLDSKESFIQIMHS